MHLSYSPSITFLDIYSREMETCSHKVLNVNVYIIGILFVISPNWQQPIRSSGGEWLNKLVHLNNGIQLSNKTEQTIVTLTYLNGF